MAWLYIETQSYLLHTRVFVVPCFVMFAAKACVMCMRSGAQGPIGMSWVSSSSVHSFDRSKATIFFLYIIDVDVVVVAVAVIVSFVSKKNKWRERERNGEWLGKVVSLVNTCELLLYLNLLLQTQQWIWLFWYESRVECHFQIYCRDDFKSECSTSRRSHRFMLNRLHLCAVAVLAQD